MTSDHTAGPTVRWKRTWDVLPAGVHPDVVLDRAWGRVVFGQTLPVTTGSALPCAAREWPT